MEVAACPLYCSAPSTFVVVPGVEHQLAGDATGRHQDSRFGTVVAVDHRHVAHSSGENDLRFLLRVGRALSFGSRCGSFHLEGGEMMERVRRGFGVFLKKATKFNQKEFQT